MRYPAVSQSVIGGVIGGCRWGGGADDDPEVARRESGPDLTTDDRPMFELQRNFKIREPQTKPPLGWARCCRVVSSPGTGTCGF